MAQFALDRDMAASFAELSASAARNRLFSQKAKADGKKQTAMLFSAMAEAEEIMARRALIALRGKISALDDYLAEIAETKKQAAEQFAQRAGAAEKKGEDSAADAYGRFGAVSRNHGQRLASGGGGEESALYVCQVCGYIAEGEVPERCPVCNAVAKKFQAHSL
jgi:rubrerythrin